MNVPSSAILTVIGAIIGATIITNLFLFSSNGMSIAGQANRKRDQAVNVMAADIINQYDGRNIVGSDLIRSVPDLLDKGVTVIIKTSTGSSVTYDEDADLVEVMKDLKNPDIISPNIIYTGKSSLNPINGVNRDVLTFTMKH